MSTPDRPMVSTSRRAASLPTRLLLFRLGVPADLVAQPAPYPPPPRFRLGIDPPAQALQPAGDHRLLGLLQPGAAQVLDRAPDVHLAGAPQPPVAGAQGRDERAGDLRVLLLADIVVVDEV